jgi:hypothetical protein
MESRQPLDARDTRVVWTRGKGCAELADLLGDGESNRITGDLVEECISRRGDILVTRRLPSSFDLVDVAVPLDFVSGNVTKVVSAVGGGPHSALAAQTAATLGRRLGVEAEMVSATTPGDDPGKAMEVIDRLGLSVDEIGGRVIEVSGIAELVETVDEGSLLVLGAPGGSWFKRAMFGPGARLRSKARAGAVVVRKAPERVFRWMGEPVYVSPMRQADDTLRIHEERVLAVADSGLLIGLVRRENLAVAGSSAVGLLMEEAMSAKVDETIDEARELEPTFGDDPIPVTDHDEHLVGGLSLRQG